MIRPLAVIFIAVFSKKGFLKAHENQTTTGARYNLRPETVIIAGSPRLPENITAEHVFGYITIELEVFQRYKKSSN